MRSIASRAVGQQLRVHGAFGTATPDANRAPASVSPPAAQLGGEVSHYAPGITAKPRQYESSARLAPYLPNAPPSPAFSTQGRLMQQSM